MSAVVSDATRRDMAELVRRYLDRADTDDHRDQLVNLASLLRHATAHNAALAGAVEQQVAELCDAQAALDILVQENARLARVQGKAHEPVSEQAWLGHRPDELAIPSPTAAAPGVVGDDRPGVGEPPAPAPGHSTSDLLTASLNQLQLARDHCVCRYMTNDRDEYLAEHLIPDLWARAEQLASRDD